MLGFLRSNVRSVNVNNLEPMPGGAELIDIREPYEYKGGSLRTSKNIPMGNLLNDPEKYLSRNKTYYIMCQSGGRSLRTCGHLSRLGYDVINVSGGMGAYQGTKGK